MDKLVRVLALEDTRSLGGGELDRLLRDPDRGVRRRAALAAGRIGDVTLVPTLVDLMNDQEPLIRQMAAFALGLLGDRAAVDRLVASLADSDPVVRGRTAEALGRIGDVRAGPELARFVLATMPKGAAVVTVRGDDPGSLNDPWLELRLSLLALGRLKDARSAELALVERGQPRFDWWVATWVAMRLESPTLKPVLVAAVASNDPLSRALGARGLGALKDPSAVELLTPLVRDQSEGVVVAAIRALGALGDARGVAAVAGSGWPRRARPCSAKPCVRSPSFPATARGFPASLPWSATPTRRSARPRWARSRAPTATTSPSSSRGSTPTPSGSSAPRSPPPSATWGTRRA